MYLIFARGLSTQKGGFLLKTIKVSVMFMLPRAGHSRLEPGVKHSQYQLL